MNLNNSTQTELVQLQIALPFKVRRGAAARFRTGRVSAMAACLLMLASHTMCAQVQNLFQITDATFANHMEYHDLAIPKGGEVALADLAGPGKVTYFYITDSSNGRFYPGLVLRVFWDDEKTPSINVPLSDFFGAIASETIDYQSAVMQINHLCYMSYLPMPFSKRARFILANDGDRNYHRSVAYGIDYEKGRAFATEKSRLHCVWKRSNPTDGMHTILEARGQGHYVGNFLQVFTRFKGWWGEGDTIFHVEGKKITHTPGTEDEYGACWGFGHLYSYAYSGYIQMNDGKNRMYRWNLANPVRFKNSLKVEIQNQRATREGPTPPSQDDYTSVAYWYQQEPHAAIALAPFSERTAASRAVEYEQAH